MHRSNRGFTLIELLVVITIIGILIALLIPAVNMVREDGRQTTCLNNQIQLGKAILAYESAKGHIPGVFNKTARGVQYSWVEALFPYLDHGDMWDVIQGSNTNADPQMKTLGTTHLNITVCPNDSYLDDRTSLNYQALLSYGVNDGYFVSYLSNPPVDRNGTVQAPAILSKFCDRPNPNPKPNPNNSPAYPLGQVATTGAIIMLGERTGNGTKTYPRMGIPAYPTKLNPPLAAYYPTAGKWTDFDPNTVGWNSLAFHWPTPAELPGPPPAPASIPATCYWPLSPNILTSTHPGKVIVVYFDGHGEKVTDDTQFLQHPQSSSGQQR